MRNTGKLITLFTLLSLAAACSSAEDAPPESTGNLSSELQVKFNSYAQAVVNRDTDALTSLMSTEIHERASEMGMDMGAFADKLYASMLTQDESMESEAGLASAFSVDSAENEGNAVRVEVSFHGKKLAKPFYFVKEDGEYRLNLLRPGFTKPVPEGAGASLDSYLLRNENSFSVSVSCPGVQRSMLPYAEGHLICDSKCGFFSGSRFYSPSGDGRYLKCDWNTWGVDVFYNASEPIGLRCNDRC